MSRQQCAFSKESSKHAGCGSLKRNFYARFIPIFKDFGAVTWLRKRSMGKIYTYWNERCKICPFGIIVVHKVIVRNKKNYFTGGKCYAKFFYTKRTCKES